MSIRLRLSTAPRRMVRQRYLQKKPQSKNGEEKDSFSYYLDGRGHQHFDFRQKIWLEPNVEMAFGRVCTVALMTLAVNLLIQAGAPNSRQQLRQPGRLNIQEAARAFCEDCLLTAPRDAWILPRDAINAWIETYRRTSMPRHSTCK